MPDPTRTDLNVGRSKPKEPVISRAFISAALQLLGLAGVMSQADFNLLVDVLVVILPPAITMIGAWLARGRVTPVE